MMEILFHGSHSLFTEFSLDNAGSNGSAQGIGIYLSKNKELASMYGRINDTQGFLYSVSANL